MIELRRNLIYRIVGPVMFLVAIVLYCSTLARGAFPDASSYYMIHMSGIEPRLAPSDPVFYLVGRLIALGPVQSIALRLNGFSAICGAISVWLMFQLVSMFVYCSIEKNPVNQKSAVWASLIAGFVAGTAMMFSEPFWSLSNRFHVGGFHVLIVLLLSRLFASYLETGSQKKLLLFALLFGVGIVEYPALIPFLGLVAPFTIFWLWGREELETRIVMKLLAASLLGLSFYFISAGLFHGSRIYSHMPSISYWRVLLTIWRDQYYLLTRSLPDSGWLIIVMMTLVPWFVCLCMARRGLNSDPNPSLFLMHTAITVIAVLVVWMFDIIKEPVNEAYIRIVLPFVLNSALFGYLAAYWFLLPSSINPDTESKLLLFCRKRMGYLLTLPFIVTVVLMPFFSYRESNARAAEFIDAYTERIIDCVSDGGVLVVGSELENNLHLKAYQRKKDIKVVNIARTRNDVYLSYLAEELNNPVLKMYAEVSIVPMLKAWLAADDDAVNKLVIFDMPDLWRQLGYEPIPDKLVFRGTLLDRTINELYVDNLKFLDAQTEFLNRTVDDSESLAFLFDNCLRHMGRVANNLGVFLQDNDKQTEAYNSYKYARKIDSDNVSALLNISIMHDSGYEVAEIESIRLALEAISKDNTRKLGIWSLSHMYGYVRHPEALVRQGMTWALSGNPDLAIQGLKRAERLAPAKGQVRIRGLIATMYFKTGEIGESRTVYRELLKANPANRIALMGLARVSLYEGNLSEAKEFLEKAEAAGCSDISIKQGYALLAIKTGDYAAARVIVQDFLADMGDKVPGYVMLAHVLRASGDVRDKEELGRCLDLLQNQPRGKKPALLLRGEIALSARNLAEAYTSFSEALRYDPVNLDIQERLLRLDFVMRNKSLVATRARNILSVDADNSFANYVLASIKTAENKYDIAESLLRKSIASKESPEALNDLAWLLCLKDELKEAEVLIRKAIELNANIFIFWDTRGEILLKKGEIDAAVSSFQKALALNGNNYGVHVHFAEALLARGDKEQARQLLDVAFPKMSLLSHHDQVKIVELRKAVR